MPMKNKAAQKLGRLGGKKTSEAKAAAAKANGAKGGRTTSRRRLIEDMRKARTETKADLSEDDNGNRNSTPKAVE